MNKIVFFNSTMGLGGVARVISVWSNLFVKNGFNVDVVSNDNLQSFYELNSEINHYCFNVHKFGKKDRVKIFFKLRSFLKSRKNQVLIFNKSFFTIYILILRRLKLISDTNKYVYYIHGSDTDLKSHYNNLKKVFMFYAYDEVIAIIKGHDSFENNFNKSIKRKFIDRLLPDLSPKILLKTKYINNPLSFKSPQAATLLNKKVLIINRLEKVKGHHKLLEIWKKISNSVLDWELTIIGNGEEEYNLKNIVKSNNINRVKFVSATNNVLPYYLESSIFINVSKEEGFGMPMLEAMHCGLPVLAFENIGSKHLIKYNNGVLCENGDVVGFANELLKLMSSFDLRSRLGSSGRLTSEKYYEENLLPLWKDILNK